MDSTEDRPFEYIKISSSYQDLILLEWNQLAKESKTLPTSLNFCIDNWSMLIMAYLLP